MVCIFVNERIDGRGNVAMSGFERIIGHEPIIEHLKNAVKHEKVSHAYIFSGEEGAGKRMLAAAFAQTLQCSEKGLEPCGTCLSCIQAESGNQPDIIWVSHEKPNSIGVEDIREQIVGDMQIKPYNSPRKIYIIDETKKMTIQAQNTLLKTIEEPPAYGMIFLLTTNAEIFLPTILSRCVVLNLKPVGNKKIKTFLMEEIKIPDYKADLCIAFAQGNVGKAIKLACSESFEEMKGHVIRIFRNIEGMELSDLLSALKELEQFKTNIYDYLDLSLVWFRDVLLFKVTHDANVLVFREEVSALQKHANRSSYEGLECIITAIEKVKVRLRANVNFELAIELMLLTIKENL